MAHELIDTGGSRSFPEPHALLAATTDRSDIVLIVGAHAAEALHALREPERYAAILVELGTECLGVHTGETRGEEGSNVLGFARFRLGSAPPSDCVEVVRQPRTPDAALAAARRTFEAHGLKVAVCGDFPGRIIDRLVRPYYNAALKRLDEGLANAADLDTTLKLGLGYPEGPIALLERTGLAEHYDVTDSLYEALGDPAYLPARRARVAKLRQRGNS
ncbi:MAG TPA: 3-hydroxyacyl-CoA dehydrogenase family protein [Burkholderiales bacterium]|nr:3-hydroxyacyl-CoA dehydrogenase family protein [Burkholderiales bacterium]